jgi:hypothetical protein
MHPIMEAAIHRAIVHPATSLDGGSRPTSASAVRKRTSTSWPSITFESAGWQASWTNPPTSIPSATSSAAMRTAASGRKPSLRTRRAASCSTRIRCDGLRPASSAPIRTASQTATSAMATACRVRAQAAKRDCPSARQTRGHCPTMLRTEEPSSAAFTICTPIDHWLKPATP